MTVTQFYLAIGVAMLFNALLFTILMAYVNAKIAGLEGRFESKFESINNRFEGINNRFEAINQRFDDMRQLWLTELHRVEGVLDARLKHLEDERRH